MADQLPPWSSRQGAETDSAVLSMQVDEMEVSEDNSDASDSFPAKDQSQKTGGTSRYDLHQRISENVTQMVWQAGTQSARKAWNVYGNIDILRPYFDVEPKEVQKRLVFSLIPQRPTSQRQQVPRELYGPTMVVLTMIALLLYQMKSADHIVPEGTLMGSALALCFTYWLGASGFVTLLAYVCSVRIVMLQVLSMIGYGMFGHCIVLFLGTVIHTAHDHLFFYLLWAVIGGLSALRMACIIMSRASGKTERIIVITAITTLHLLFLLYLHFAYHTVVEELSEVLERKLVPLPVGNADSNADPNLTAQVNKAS